MTEFTHLPDLHPPLANLLRMERHSVPYDISTTQVAATTLYTSSMIGSYAHSYHALMGPESRQPTNLHVHILATSCVYLHQ